MHLIKQLSIVFVVCVVILMGWCVVFGVEEETKEGAAKIENSWALEVPELPGSELLAKYGLSFHAFQTTFEETRLASRAPIDSRTAIGVPGTIPLDFNWMMFCRYSEFGMLFTVATDEGEKNPYVLDNFRQVCPEGWLPGCISTWDHQGIHYQVSVIMVPGEPQPFECPH